MTKLILVWLLALGINAFGALAAQSVIRDASSTNIPDAYASAGGSLLVLTNPESVYCINDTGSTVRLCIADAAADCTSDLIRLEDGQSFRMDNNNSLASKTIFAKGESAAVTSGNLSCYAFDRY